jgi:hypothetical protein
MMRIQQSHLSAYAACAAYHAAGSPGAAAIRRIMSGSKLLADIGPECGDRSCIALAAFLGRGYRHFCGTTKFM